MTVTMSQSRIEALMRLAIQTAGESVAEDAGVRPRVGAVLASPNGCMLLRCHRGETPGAHAEFLLLEKAREKNIDTRGCILFATLEPCTTRGPGKIPCAQRVGAAGLSAIYIGTFDPNPNITGRGEAFLSYTSMTVGNFPPNLAKELKEMNRPFFAQYEDAHVPAISLYASRGPNLHLSFPKPRLSNDRNELLQQTLDLVSGDRGDIWVRAGDMSWWREAQTTFLQARLDRRKVRISTSPSDPNQPSYREARSAAEALGAVVVEQPADPSRLRGTMVDPGTDQAAMVVIDQGDRLLLRSPDDEGLMKLVFEDMNRELGDEALPGATEGRPQMESLTESQLVDALRGHVPQYADAEISYGELDAAVVRPLTRHLERFKLFRATRLEALQLSNESMGMAAKIVGSPWPITPPVVEMRKDGPVVVDGTHRAFLHLRRGVGAMKALVVDGTAAPLPARPLPDWQEVAVYDTKLPRLRRYDEYTGEHFRPIRAAFASLASTDHTP